MRFHPGVVPVNAGGPITPRHRVIASWLTTFPHNIGRWLWVLRSQGRRIMCSALARDELLQISIFKQRRHSFAISPLVRASFAIEFPPSPIRGRRECRAPDAPDSRVCNDSGRTHTR